MPSSSDACRAAGDCHGVNYVGAGRRRHAMQFRFLAFRQIAIARSPIAERVHVKRTRGDVGGGNHARFCFLFAAGRFAFWLPRMHALDLRARDAGGRWVGAPAIWGPKSVAVAPLPPPPRAQGPAL
uniref:Uncharacterized protein n=1 Tax=Oryza glumipatula TaxID=40148 RepID=A0A0D9YZD2_9ORYZ